MIIRFWILLILAVLFTWVVLRLAGRPVLLWKIVLAWIAILLSGTALLWALSYFLENYA